MTTIGFVSTPEMTTPAPVFPNTIPNSTAFDGDYSNDSEHVFVGNLTILESGFLDDLPAPVRQFFQAIVVIIMLGLIAMLGGVVFVVIRHFNDVLRYNDRTLAVGGEDDDIEADSREEGLILESDVDASNAGPRYSPDTAVRQRHISGPVKSAVTTTTAISSASTFGPPPTPVSSDIAGRFSTEVSLPAYQTPKIQAKLESQKSSRKRRSLLATPPADLGPHNSTLNATSLTTAPLPTSPIKAAEITVKAEPGASKAKNVTKAKNEGAFVGIVRVDTSERKVVSGGLKAVSHEVGSRGICKELDENKPGLNRLG